MGMVTFRCPACQTAFGVPAERITPTGAGGRCRACGASLSVFPDGRAMLRAEDAPVAPDVPPQAPAAAGPDLAAPRIWEVRKREPDPDFPPGPFTATEVRDLIFREAVLEDDLARITEGDWAPARSYPALAALFAEYLQSLRTERGHARACALHPDRQPGWRCLKCHLYLCAECTRNEPIIAGGAPHYVCAHCGGETEEVKRAGGLKGLVGGILGRG